MTFERLLLSPVLPYGLFSAALIGALYLFYTLKRDISRLQGRCQHQAAALQGAVQRTETKLAELEEDYERFLRGARTSILDSRKLGAFCRAKIHSLHVQGEQTPEIAERLGMPDAQVDLALKVQRLTDGVPLES